MKWLFFLLLTNVTQLLFAQKTVMGLVRDSGSSETLPFATVVIKGSQQGTSTNLDGHFTLLNVPSDTSTLVISYVGYSLKEIKLSPGMIQSSVAALLDPLSASLEELVISDYANKFLNISTGVSHATIATRQLSLLPTIGEVDIFRSLQLLPGVSGTNENSSGLFVRGGTPDQNLVLLDGMTVYKVDHFFGFFSAFNANAIKDVQLYKGAFPARYGGRISSVVELTGKTGNFTRITGEGGINLISANAYLELPISSKFSFLLAGRRSYTDILQSDVFRAITNNLLGGDPFPGLPNLTNTQVNVVQPLFYFYDWNSKLTYRPNDRDLLTVSVYQGQDYLDKSRSFVRTIPRGNQDPVVVTGNIKEKTDWGNKGISGKWSRQWGPKFYSNMLVAASSYNSNYNRKGFLDVGIPAQDSTIFSGKQFTAEDNNVQDVSARFDAEWLVSSRHKIEFGISFTESDINYKNIRNDTVTILDRVQNGTYSSAYVSDTWQPVPKLTVTGGLRASYYQLTRDYLYAPRFSASYGLTNRIKLKAAFGRHYQFTNQIINENLTEGSRDFWLLADGNQVTVSSATHYIAGISYETNGWLVDVEAYHKDLSGLTEFSLRFRRGLEINGNQLFFTGQGIARGVELLVQKKAGNYTGWIAYTLGRVTHNFAGLNEGLDFSALHDQRHEFKMVHSYQVERWNFAATFIFGSGKPFSEPAGKYDIGLLDGRSQSYIGVGPKNGSRLPAYHRLDLSVHRFFPLGKKLKGDLGISVFNVYNRQNTWYKEFDFTQDPVLITQVTYLGMTPNVSFNVKF
ncbi:MAG: TonB-dependent receptor [Cytophagales bacterium]|nr:TonB-dependent receptor [Cytophagales bacterium]